MKAVAVCFFLKFLLQLILCDQPVFIHSICSISFYSLYFASCILSWNCVLYAADRFKFFLFLPRAFLVSGCSCRIISGDVGGVSCFSINAVFCVLSRCLLLL